MRTTSKIDLRIVTLLSISSPVGFNPSNSHYIDTSLKTKSITIFSIKLEGREFKFKKDQNGHPFIVCDTKPYKSLLDLIKAFPKLKNKEKLNKLAQFANFMIKGTEFVCIDCVKTFKEKYKQQLDFKKNSYDSSLFKIPYYGVFDVDELKSPNIDDNALIYYVINFQNVPYRATCQLSSDSDPVAKYELLPNSE